MNTKLVFLMLLLLLGILVIYGIFQVDYLNREDSKSWFRLTGRIGSDDSGSSGTSEGLGGGKGSGSSGSSGFVMMRQ